MLVGEGFHEGGELGAALGWHGVVDAGAHAFDFAVAGESGESCCFGGGDEGLVEVVGLAAEGDVHDRAAVGVCVGDVEAVGVVDGIVEDGCFVLVVRLDLIERAELVEDPFEDAAHHVDGEGVGRVGA